MDPQVDQCLENNNIDACNNQCINYQDETRLQSNYKVADIIEEEESYEDVKSGPDWTMFLFNRVNEYNNRRASTCIKRCELSEGDPSLCNNCAYAIGSGIKDEVCRHSCSYSKDLEICEDICNNYEEYCGTACEHTNNLELCSKACDLGGNPSSCLKVCDIMKNDNTIPVETAFDSCYKVCNKQARIGEQNINYCKDACEIGKNITDRSYDGKKRYVCASNQPECSDICIDYGMYEENNFNCCRDSITCCDSNCDGYNNNNIFIEKRKDRCTSQCRNVICNPSLSFPDGRPTFSNCNDDFEQYKNYLLGYTERYPGELNTFKTDTKQKCNFICHNETNIDNRNTGCKNLCELSDDSRYCEYLCSKTESNEVCNSACKMASLDSSLTLEEKERICNNSCNGRPECLSQLEIPTSPPFLDQKQSSSLITNKNQGTDISPTPNKNQGTDPSPTPNNNDEDEKILGIGKTTFYIILTIIILILMIGGYIFYIRMDN